MIIIRNLTVNLGLQPILNDISLVIDTGKKNGLVGRNGAGKTTFLKVLAGICQKDEGTISTSGGLRIAYLPQNLVFSSLKTVLSQVVEGAYEDSRFAEANNEKISLEDQEKTSSERVLYSQYSDKEYAQRANEAREILAALGFSESDLAKTVKDLSVGWRMRVALAQLLMEKADFYLFDEPTNHLDLPSKRWFVQFLQKSSWGYLLVSHDRFFLDKACNRIIEIERGAVNVYDGNFSFYVSEKERRQESVRATYERMSKEKQRLQETVDRFKGKPSKAAMAKSIEKKIEKMVLIPPEPVLPAVSFSFPPIARAGDTVLNFEGIGHSFGKKAVFKNCSGYVMRGKKVALVAANGVGKSTFLNILTGAIAVQVGSVKIGYNVSKAYFQQDQASTLPGHETIIDHMLSAIDAPASTIRSVLGNFLFTGDDVYKFIEGLSGGEKNRLAMAKILLSEANFLLLDEPTNHLDIYAKEVLAQAIRQYKGTVLLVSHDQDFIERTADCIMELTPEGIYMFDGSYEDFLYSKSSSKDSKVQLISSKEHNSVIKPLNRHELNKTLRSCEAKIEKLEHARNELGLKIASLTYGMPEYQKAINQFKELEAELAQELKKWEELADKVMS